MFYTHAILTKRGPLARLWLAAHWDKKLTKAQIFETDIRLSCESILEPCLKLALRTKGHLLLGVVRIYSRKTKYLLADCNEAFIKIKMAFRPGIVGIESTTNNHIIQDVETREVSIAAITLPENFHDFDTINLNFDYMDDPTRFHMHQARAEEITLKEDFISEPMAMDDDFGETNGLDEPEFFRHVQPSINGNAQHTTMNLDQTNAQKDQSLARPFTDDPFALDGFGDFPAPASVIHIGDDRPNLTTTDKDHYDHVMSPFHQDDNNQEPIVPIDEPPAQQMDVDQPMVGVDDTTLLSNVSDEFILAPITTAQTPAATARQALKRKRKLIVDEVKEIDSTAMKVQLSDTTDIVGVLELAPPTRRLMYLKETGSVDKLFSSSVTSIYSKTLQQLITRNFLVKALDQMTPDNYQIQYDQVEQEQNESSIDQMRADPNLFIDIAPRDLTVHSRKRTLSPENQSIIDKRQRIDDSLVFPPLITSMDNFIDVLPEPLSPTRKSTRTLQELNYSPTRSKRKKDSNKENQDNDDDDEDEQGQTIQEDFESGKKLNRRAKTMLNAFERTFESSDKLSFHQYILSANPTYQTRKLTAQKFYTLLVLKKLQAINVEQSAPYEDITITQGMNFTQCK